VGTNDPFPRRRSRAHIAYLVGAPDVIGPVLGIAFAAIIAGDPRHIIWRAPADAVAQPPAVETQAGLAESTSLG
jgi:hypothetical protein